MRNGTLDVDNHFLLPETPTTNSSMSIIGSPELMTRLLISEEPGGELLRVKFEISLADKILGPEPKIGGHSSIGDYEAALGVFDKQIVRDLVDHRPE